MEFEFLDHRPIIVAIAGPNGAGKTTFYQAHLADTGLRYINADDLARELNMGPYEAAEAANALRHALVARRESFIFETVFSDPVGDKVQFLHDAVGLGYQVVLIFIRINDLETSIQRVSMRVAQGGHDVPDEKLQSRFERTLENLQRAIDRLPHVLIFDNSDLSQSFQHVATWRDGEMVE